MVVRLVDERRTGIFHVTNQGAVSWFEFAQSVLRAAGLDPGARPSDRDRRPRASPPGAAPGELRARQRRAARRRHRAPPRLSRAARPARASVDGFVTPRPGRRRQLQRRRPHRRLPPEPGRDRAGAPIDSKSCSSTTRPTDGVVARVRRELPVVTVIESDRNLGFAGGCNLGMRDRRRRRLRRAREQRRDRRSRLARAARRQRWSRTPSLGAACPKVVFADSGLIDNVGVERGPWGRGADRGHLEPIAVSTTRRPTCSRGAVRPSFSAALPRRGRRIRRATLPLLRGPRARVARSRVRLALPHRPRSRSSATCTAPPRSPDSPLQRSFNLRERAARRVAARAAPDRRRRRWPGHSSRFRTPRSAIRTTSRPERARSAEFLRLAPAMLRERAHDRAEARQLQSPSDGRECGLHRRRQSRGHVERQEVRPLHARHHRHAAGPVTTKPRLLDFGAGTGTIAERVTELGYEVTCLEPDAVAARDARRAPASDGARSRGRRGDRAVRRDLRDQRHRAHRRRRRCARAAPQPAPSRAASSSSSFPRSRCSIRRWTAGSGTSGATD